ncbi:sensor domain-containing diguanylate cyclase [Nitratiruptor sp. SB155-2]|uniref:sensor domain-containing diguanylate cyclase n=1 Tax=Nitratiruptor sp. (strain SB155-2) TaxID=387092 RepID=UPI0001586F14|nr:sensor domain-containing diguanylate cyclase [Nitratiruptor sp. SB155-2]BAF69250.1 hypothetical protein NIS_0135 [Nitratiruptor sp. SB155-2]
MSRGATQWKIFSLLLLFATVILLLFIVVENRFLTKSVQKAALENAIQKAKEREEVFRTFLNQQKDLLQALRQSHTVIQTCNQKKISPKLEDLFMTMMRANPQISRIQLEVPKANFVIGVKRQKNHYISFKKAYKKFVYPSNRLHDKVVFSSIFLKKDESNTTIPFITASLPLYEKSVLKGLLSIDISIDTFLQRLLHMPLYDTVLFDNEGYPLIHYNHDYDWARYNNIAYTIFTQYPDFYKKILQNRIYKSDSFVTARFDLDLNDSLYMMFKLNRDYLTRQKEQFVKQILIVSALVFFFTIAIAWLLTKIFDSHFSSLEEIETLHKKQKQINKKLTMQTMEFQALFEFAQAGFAIVDIYTKEIIKINKKMMEILGFTKEEILGKKYTKFVTSRFQDRIKTVLRSAVEQGKVENFIAEFTAKNGRIKILKSSIIFLPDQERLLITCEDYTAVYLREQNLIKAAQTDVLTNLPNRSAYQMKLEEQMSLFERYQTVFSMLCIDIDHFKKINDTYGHKAGDKVLQEVAKIMRKTLRSSDTVFRIGGEEFVALLPETDLVAAKQAAQKLRTMIQDQMKLGSYNVTVSIGVTQVNFDDTYDSIFMRCDKCLYHAKQNGRNQVVSSENL